MKLPLIIVSGPTASGKTDIAVNLARHFSGEVINADSVQMYQECRIGSAKPTLEEQQGVPHHLFDVCMPNQKNSAALFLEKAQEKISDLQSLNKTIIVCGGTMLYIKALLYGLAELPQGDAVIRKKLEQLSNEELYKRLIAIDSTTKINQNDTRRMVRALEVYQLNKMRASELQNEHAFSNPLYNTLILLPIFPRDYLYERINLRTEKMIDEGIIEETRQIINKYGEEAAVLKSVGYQETCQFIQGKITREDLAPAIAQATRQLAKKQITFWRNEPKKRGWSFCDIDGNDISYSLQETKSPKSRKSVQKDFIVPTLSLLDIYKGVENFQFSDKKQVKVLMFRPNI